MSFGNSLPGRFFCFRATVIPCPLSVNKTSKMKKTARSVGVSLLASAALLTLSLGCTKSRNTRTYTIYTPVYSLRASALASINGDPAKSIESSGKIYVWGQYIFLNEPNSGIHVIDNHDPAHPVQTAWLSIPGNLDMAIKGNTLYADMYQDLLAIDISNIHQVKVTGKVPNLFTDRSYVNGYFVGDSSIVTRWITRDTTVVVLPDARPGPSNGCCQYAGPTGVYTASAYASTSSTTTGTAGSMAAMVLINDYLYAISEGHSLGVVNLTDPSKPSLAKKIQAGFDLETIYPFQDKLFLGSAEGVYVYELSNPASPAQTTQFTHGRACDPVITDGNYAYVTLHAGTSCGGSSNELDVVDVRNLTMATNIRTYPMTKPQGLCKDGDLLFVCDGSLGVKVFNAKNPANLQQLTTSGNSQAYGVIAANQRLLVVADKGLYQYDYSDPSNLKLLSLFPTKK
jgi:hypothetical protein